MTNNINNGSIQVSQQAMAVWQWASMHGTRTLKLHGITCDLPTVACQNVFCHLNIKLYWTYRQESYKKLQNSNIIQMLINVNEDMICILIDYLLSRVRVNSTVVLKNNSACVMSITMTSKDLFSKWSFVAKMTSPRLNDPYVSLHDYRCFEMSKRTV